MAREHIEDFFETDAWEISERVIESAEEAAMIPAEINLHLLDGTRIPHVDVGIREGDDPTREKLEEDEEEGIFWIDIGALKAAITYGVAWRLREAYLLGRVDQASDMLGEHGERFVTARELGRVISTQTVLNKNVGAPGDLKSTRILNEVISKNGSLLNLFRKKIADINPS